MRERYEGDRFLRMWVILLIIFTAVVVTAITVSAIYQEGLIRSRVGSYCLIERGGIVNWDKCYREAQ